VSYATVGAGSIGHLEGAGVRLVHVPYRGGGPASNDLIVGHVDLMIASTAQSIPQIQARLIRKPLGAALDDDQRKTATAIS